MAVGAIATALVGSPAVADDQPPPDVRSSFVYGYGLGPMSTTARPGEVADTPFDFVFTVSTSEVAGTAMNDGGHHIRIVLPSDYYSNPTKRYPVLYLLNGSDQNADAATYFNGYDKVDSNAGMIYVIPDGGTRSWYSNWLNQNSPAGAQRWENFHINQVIPFIDANLRTMADKQHRAIAGISMGGFRRRPLRRAAPRPVLAGRLVLRRLGHVPHVGGPAHRRRHVADHLPARGRQ
ncbi:alpha/beta hydrolase [Yinghuangia aomiensis]